MTHQGIPDGWIAIPSNEFITLVGPLYRPADVPVGLSGFLADQRHGNKRGVVHGGMMATAFDSALGNAAWNAAGHNPCATIQLNVHYIGALNVGEFATIRTEVTRATKSVVFLRAVMAVDERVIATADGVWKILQWRGAAFTPRPTV